MIKTFKSPNYNFVFNTDNGFFARWGNTKEQDPEYSPFGPEILDMEISTVCSRACSWCYKSNNHKGKNMTFDTFKSIFDKLPKHLTQIAFGVGDIDANPDLWKIMEYCRTNNVIPNITINGERMTTELYDKLASVCGAVAVSLYNKNTCYNAVAELTKRMKQVNIHCLLSLETYRLCLTTINDIKTDPRLEKLNAIVYLWLKPKGERNCFHQITKRKYGVLVSNLLDNNIRFGFDSCTAANFLKTVKAHDKFDTFKTMTEPCESTLFSYYINVDGMGFPCSFSETSRGTNILDCGDFVKDVWYAPETKLFRDKLISNKDDNGCRMCPVYNLCV